MIQVASTFRNRVGLAIALFGAVVLIAGPFSANGNADNVAFQQAMAKAVREAANRVLPSVVAIEIVGTSGSGSGEVETDAPTSGVVVDTDGHVLASSIVVSRPSASILVVLPDGTRHAAKVVAVPDPGQELG